MKKYLLLICLFILPCIAQAQGYDVINARADIASGVITGDFNGKKFSAPLRGDGHIYILSGGWFGGSSGGRGLRLNLSLPSGYTALAEADRAEKTAGGWTFTLDHPSSGITLAVSDSWTVKTENYKGTELAVYFSGDNVSAADAYFARLKTLLDTYTSILGKYPYGRFAVADVPYPVGHALISLTFISDKIVRMPFLTDVSLGHELLHQWFGVSVAIPSDGGNWAEGLTTYMADRLYADQDGRGAQYRLNSLMNIIENTEQTGTGQNLGSFRYNSGKFAQAVGYSKGLMLFSMLEELIGQADFYKSLKNICADYRFKTASWDDLQREFENASGRDLCGFFHGWLTAQGIADFDVSVGDVTAKDGRFVTSFQVDNKNDTLQFPLEIVIKTDSGDVSKIIYVSKMRETFTVRTDGRPLSLVIDPQYKTDRMPDMTELKPVMYSLFSDNKKAVFVSKADRDKYSAVMAYLHNAEVFDDTADPYRYTDRVLVFLGGRNRAYERFFGADPAVNGDFYMQARLHPLRDDRMAYVIYGRDADAVKEYFPRAAHYGSAETIKGENGRLASYETTELSPQTVMLKKDKQGVRVHPQLSLKDIIDENPYAKVIYVGEIHDRFAHHLNQLDTVRLLDAGGRKPAIGLEMIQKPFQKYLDAYIAGKIDEKEMLKKTEYYDRWRFDFRMYRPIFEYAREHGIPLVALNAPQELSQKVAEKGISGLTEKEREQLPQTFEYTGGDYKSRLYDVFMQHKQKNFENFYEAQLIWDETMAQTADDYMRAHPDRTMVILAGNGHIRFRSAIPDRLFRRNHQNYITILQDEDNENGIGDYILYPDDVKYEESPKLGISLDDTKGIEVKEVVKGSPADKAGIKKDDVIISYNGATVQKLSDLKLGLLYSGTGGEYPVTVRRGGTDTKLKVRF